MRQLSADCDRETGCIPQCHLVLSSYVGSDRRVLIAYHDGFSLSPSVSTYPSIYLLCISLSLSLSRGSLFSQLPTTPLDALALPSPAHRLNLDATHHRTGRLFRSHVGGCLTRYTRNTSRKWDR